MHALIYEYEFINIQNHVRWRYQHWKNFIHNSTDLSKPIEDAQINIIAIIFYFKDIISSNCNSDLGHSRRPAVLVQSISYFIVIPVSNPFHRCDQLAHPQSS